MGKSSLLGKAGAPPLLCEPASYSRRDGKKLFIRGNKHVPRGVYSCWRVFDRNNEAVTFEELAMPLLEALYNFARYLARDRSEADDLVQETYLKALKGFSSFQPGTNFRAWMFRILHNTFLTSKTGLAASRTVSLDDDEREARPVAVTRETPESLLLQSASDEMVRAAIADVPLIYREALLLCDVEEMSYQEIAEALAIPVGTVMSRISRGRKAVRDRLQEKALEAKHG